MSYSPPIPTPVKLLPLSTRVTHFDGGDNTHGRGTIVDYNNVRSCNYLKEDFKGAVDLAAPVGLLGGLVDSFYCGSRCPYVVQWDNGYKDVYEPTSINEYVFDREAFKVIAEKMGYKVSSAFNPYDDPETEKAYELWKQMTIKSQIATCPPHKSLSPSLNVLQAFESGCEHMVFLSNILKQSPAFVEPNFSAAKLLIGTAKNILHRSFKIALLNGVGINYIAAQFQLSVDEVEQMVNDIDA